MLQSQSYLVGILESNLCIFNKENIKRQLSTTLCDLVPTLPQCQIPYSTNGKAHCVYVVDITLSINLSVEGE